MRERRALELFCGAADITAALRLRGWTAYGLDIDPKRQNADILGDALALPIRGHFDFVWCSPPCVQFAPWGMPWRLDRREIPDMALVEASIAVTKLADAWIIENVRGAVRWLRPLLGAPRTHAGPWYLWSNLPIDMQAMRVDKGTTRGPNSNRAIRRLAPMHPRLVDCIAQVVDILIPS